MLFNSQAFVLGFLPCVLVLYYACARARTARLLLLVVASLLFYAAWDARFVPALVGLTLLNWAVARAFGRWRRRILLDCGILLNLGVLGLCKYANFFAAGWATLFGIPHDPWAIILPLGVSFFTFQKIGYLVDLRRGARPIYGLLEFSAFVTFFPVLIAGPLVRHDEIVAQLQADPRGPGLWENLGRGGVLFILGFAKKAALADTMALVCDPLYARAAQGTLNLAEAWAAAGTYALQIYFDFSGYSDMAVGLALMLGLRIPLNFNAPYRATSIRDFWRRWHMTLSRFLRDYVYVPLGGNRQGAWRQAANVVLTMLLGGLWHGAGWTFVAWGGLHGVALAINGVWHRAGLRMPALLGGALTLLFVILCWVPFRAPDFPTAWRVIEGLAGLHGVGRVKVDNAAVVVIAAVLAVAGPTSQSLALALLRPSRWLAPLAGAALVGLLLLAGGRMANEFIYFQF